MATEGFTDMWEHWDQYYIAVNTTTQSVLDPHEMGLSARQTELAASPTFAVALLTLLDTRWRGQRVALIGSLSSPGLHKMARRGWPKEPTTDLLKFVVAHTHLVNASRHEYVAVFEDLAHGLSRAPFWDTLPPSRYGRSHPCFLGAAAVFLLAEPGGNFSGGGQWAGDEVELCDLRGATAPGCRDVSAEVAAKMCAGWYGVSVQDVVRKP